MKYTATIQSAINPQSPSIQLGPGPVSNFDLFIMEVDILYSYLDFSTPGQMKICGFNYISPNTKTLTVPESIGSGDILQIFENGARIFLGQVLETEEHYSSDGRYLILYFDSLLASFTRQFSVQSFQQVQTTLSPPQTISVQTLQPQSVPVFNGDQNSNRVPLQDLVNFLMQQSPYEYAKQFANFDVLYETPDILSPVDFIWYYASTQSTKEQVLRMATYWYQQIIYQDQNGNLVFTLPSEQNTSSYNINDGDYNLRDYKINKREARLPNNIVYSLAYLGFFPPVQNGLPANLVSQSTPDPKYFPRSYALFNSGYFAQNQLVINSLSNDITTNPILLNLVSQYNINFVTPQNCDRSQQTMAPLLSARTLAENLTFSRMVVIELNRNAANSEIPIGKTFTLNNEAWFCVYAEIGLDIDSSGQSVKNTIKLTGVPIKSITGVWSTQPFG